MVSVVNGASPDHKYVLSDHLDVIEKMYFEQGLNYRKIGEHFGKSGEAVRQVLASNFPDRVRGRAFRKEVLQAEKAAAEVEKAAIEEQELEERRAKAPRCVVCYGPVLGRRAGAKGTNQTCSPEHAQLWSRGRFLLDPVMRAKQRKSMARSTLKYPENHKASSVAWAEKVLANKPVAARHGDYIRDSASREAYEEVMRIRGKACKTCRAVSHGRITREEFKHHEEHMRGLAA